MNMLTIFIHLLILLVCEFDVYYNFKFIFPYFVFFSLQMVMVTMRVMHQNVDDHERISIHGNLKN